MSEILTREQVTEHWAAIVRLMKDGKRLHSSHHVNTLHDSQFATIDALDAALEALRTIADELEADSDYMNLSEVARAALAATRTPDAAGEGETK